MLDGPVGPSRPPSWRCRPWRCRRRCYPSAPSTGPRPKGCSRRSVVLDDDVALGHGRRPQPHHPRLAGRTCSPVRRRRGPRRLSPPGAFRPAPWPCTACRQAAGPTSATAEVPWWGSSPRPTDVPQPGRTLRRASARAGRRPGRRRRTGPRRPSRRPGGLSSSRAVRASRVPDIPTGWPRAMAPPFTLSDVLGDPEVVRRGQPDRGEGLVDLEEVDVADASCRPGPAPGRMACGRLVEQRGVGPGHLAVADELAERGDAERARPWPGR